MGKIFDIKHFAVHDGEGIRTTVFFKGCPLRCVWCHNPEGLRANTELALFSEKCTGCASCTAACNASVHAFSDAHSVNRELCTACGKCVSACSVGALELYGKEMSVSELMPELLEDRDFYGVNGGVTLSGGECLLQADFCEELLSALKNEGVNTAVDTSGAVSREAIDAVLPYTDTFLYDIKAIDENVHIRCTGRGNRDILDNLRYLDSVGAQVEIRVPFVPDYNDGEMARIGEFVSSLGRNYKVRLLAYHRYYESKYTALGYPEAKKIGLPSKEQLDAARKTLGSFGIFTI